MIKPYQRIVSLVCLACETCECERCNVEDLAKRIIDDARTDGAREFAEWVCGKYSRIRQDSIGFEKFQNIHWKSIDEVLAEWQKGEE